MKKKETVTVLQDESKPVARGILAQAIVDISRAVKSLQSSGLNREAIIILCSHRVKPSSSYGQKPGIGDIRAVFAALAELEKEYVTR